MIEYFEDKTINDNDRSILEKLESRLGQRVGFLGEREEFNDAAVMGIEEFGFGYSRLMDEDYIDQLFLVNLPDLTAGIKGIISTLSGLTCLKHLYFVDTRVEYIPDEIETIQSLQKLSVLRGGLQHIPEALTRMINITFLGFNNNNISCLPANLWAMVPLTSMWLDNNHLEQIPENIDRLKNLIWFSITGNPVDHIPVNLFHIKTLKFARLPQSTRDKTLTALGIPFDANNFKKLQERYQFKNTTISFY